MKSWGPSCPYEKLSTFFGHRLSHLIYSRTEQLSPTLQGKETTIQQGPMAAELTIQFLERQRSNSSFAYFYPKVIEDSKELSSRPTLPRYRQPLGRPDEAGVAGYQYSTSEIYLQNNITKFWIC